MTTTAPSASSPGRQSSGRFRDWDFDTFGLRLTYLVAMILACLAPAQGDTFWLLRAGRDFWQTGHIAETDTYTYTVAGKPWPNHEWLWEVLAYPVHELGGMPLLTGINALLIVAALVLAMRLSSARGTALIAVAMVITVMIAPTATIRPQVASSLLFVVTIVLVARERYWPLIPLFLVWANLHAAVASGGLILLACALAAGVHAILTRSSESWRRVRRLGLATACAGVVTLVNPMGIGLWTYVLTSHARSKANHIAEWSSPMDLRTPIAFAFALLVLIAAVALVRRRHRIATWRDAVPLIAALATLPTAIDAVRNITAFSLAIAPVLVTLLGQPRGWRQSKVSRPLTPLIAGGAVGVIVVAAVWVTAPPRLSWHPVAPTLGAQLARCPGHVYTNYDTGAYVEWFAPEVKTFIDNRQDPFPNSMVKKVFKLDATGKFQQLFDTYDVSCAVVSPGTKLAKSLRKAGWREVSHTDRAEVYART